MKLLVDARVLAHPQAHLAQLHLLAAAMRTQILHKELDVTIAFCGQTQLSNEARKTLVPGSLRNA